MVVAVQVKNLTKELGRRVVLDDISFDVKKGEIFGIIGMSGSGKTTILNHLIGFLEPDEGEILYKSSRVIKEKKGKKAAKEASASELSMVRKNMRDVRRMFGFSPQIPSFYPRLTVKENLAHFGALHKVDKKELRENMEHLMKLTKLDGHQHKLGEHLSGGMQRRLSIMCGLIHRPDVLILDEPTADLDPILREETWKLIGEIRKMGTTIIVASHFLHELERVCDRVAIVYNGRMLRYGGVEEIKKGFARNTIEIRIETTPKFVAAIAAGVGRRGIEKIHKDDNRMTIYTRTPKETLVKIAHMLKTKKILVHSLEVHRPTLKEVFKKITLKNN